MAKRCHDICYHVKDFCARHDPEALHLLRVEVKKLKAFVYLLQQGTHNHHIQIKGLKKLYRQAGEIRAVEINKKILQELNWENQEFNDQQDQTLNVASEGFCHHASHYRQEVNRVQHDLEKEIEDIKPGKVRSFFQQGIEKLALFFSAASMEVEALLSLACND